MPVPVPVSVPDCPTWGFSFAWASHLGPPPSCVRGSNTTGTGLPNERAALLHGLTATPPVAVANGVDLGDPLAPYGSVHPRSKQPVREPALSIAPFFLPHPHPPPPCGAVVHSSSPRLMFMHALFALAALSLRFVCPCRSAPWSVQGPWRVGRVGG